MIFVYISHMEKLFSIIKDSGAKLTSPRKAVLEQLANSTQPLTLKEIYDNCKIVDFASIYRSVKLFNELGLVEEINFADKKVRYELTSKRHHHHIICSDCGDIKELPVCFLSEIEKFTEYQITKHNLEFMGICPKCKN